MNGVRYVLCPVVKTRMVAKGDKEIITECMFADKYRVFIQ